MRPALALCHLGLFVWAFNILIKEGLAPFPDGAFHIGFLTLSALTSYALVDSYVRLRNVGAESLVGLWFRVKRARLEKQLKDLDPS